MDLAQIVVSHPERAVVRVGDVFIKVDTQRKRAERERQALSIVPVPIPRVLWFRAGPPAMLALQEEAGSVLADSDRTADWTNTGGHLRKLHDLAAQDWLDPPMTKQSLTNWIEVERSWLHAHSSLESAVIERAATSASSLVDDLDRTPAVFCHGDLQADHVLVSEGVVTAILDWGDVSLGDAAYDLAVLTASNKDRLRDVLAGYGDADVPRVRAWWSLRHMAEPRWMTDHGYSPGKAVRQLRELHAT